MDQQQLITVMAVISGLTVVLIAVVFIQYRRIQSYSQPKYGFLGKPIAGAIVTGLFAFGIAGGVYLTNQDSTSIETSAKFKINISYNKEYISDNGNTSTYNFSSTVKIDDPNVTNNKFRYNVYWNFIGPQKYSASEIDLGNGRESDIQLSLKKGTYDMIILVTYVDPADGVTHSETYKDTIVI